MQKLKEKKPLLIKLLTIILLVLLCFNLPSILFFWPLCLAQDLTRPSNTEVLVSACKTPRVRGVPGGEVLFVHEYRSGKIYLLDLRTGKKRSVPNDSLLRGERIVFLSPELVWLEGSLVGPDNPHYRPNYILDLTDVQRYELLDMTLLPRLDGYKFDPKYFAFFQSADQVFIHHSENTLIALSPDFHQHPEGNVIFSQYAMGLEDKKGKLLEQLMKDLGVDYEIVDFSLQYADIASPTGKYVVRNDGIYFSGTNTPIMKLNGKFKGWYYDESGVIVQKYGYHLINIGAWGSLYYIPGPILKLRLPAP